MPANVIKCGYETKKIEASMQYVKKMCILRQLKQGFSCDGKPISGLIKAEQYGKNIAVDVSVINLAPLSAGEWYCLFADVKKRFRLLPLQEKRHFSFVDELQIEGGFLAALCCVKDEAIPVAFGISGTPPFTATELVQSAFREGKFNQPSTPEAQKPSVNADTGAPNSPNPTTQAAGKYNDEAVTEENYYQWEADNEQQCLAESGSNAKGEGTGENESAQTRTKTDDDENGACVRHAFTTHTDGYYQSVKGELNDLFARYPKDTSLCEAFTASEWVRVRGEEGAPEELVGIVFEDGLAKYICYALPAKTPQPPSEMSEHCFFVPQSPLQPTQGFFVIFQSAATGETIKRKEG